VEAVITCGEGRAVEVLLGRLAAGSSKGLWDLPGGFLNAGDRIHEALVRECHREMDIGVRVGDLLGVFEEDSFYDIPLISIVFVCSIVAGTPRAADLIDEVRWFPIDAPPQLAYPCV
jgi:8-oxo-dGTP diphosphatase